MPAPKGFVIVLAKFTETEIGFVALYRDGRATLYNTPVTRSGSPGLVVTVEPLWPIEWSLGRPVFLKVTRARPE